MSNTDFWITPDGLDDQASAIDGYAEMILEAGSWVTNHPVGVPAGSALYAGAATRAQAIERGLVQFFAHLHSVLAGVASELRSVAGEARTMDIESAAKLDACDPTEYNFHSPHAPGSASQFVLTPEGERTDDGSLFPTYRLNAGGIGFYCSSGGAYEYLRDRATTELPGDLLSPSEWLWTVGSFVGLPSIRDELFSLFGGQWVEIHEFAHMLNGLSLLLTELADRVESVAGALSVYWQGYAGNSAQAYLADLQSALAAAGRNLRSASRNFREFLESVDQALALLAGAAHGLIDSLLVAAVAASAGAAGAFTGAAPVAGTTVAAVALFYAGSRVKKIWDGVQEIDTLLTILDSVKGLSADLSDFTRSFRVPEMEATN